MLKEVEILIPPLEKQKTIVAHLDKLSNETKQLKSKYQQQLENLEEMRKSVLDQAFKGELI
jgi:type I restriction enzyme S subunit